MFGGWYTTSQCINEYDFNDPVTRNLVLYAKWNRPPIRERLIQIAANVQKVYDTGWYIGWDQGYEYGHQSGYEEGKSDGGSDSNYYNEIWDAIQNNGERTNYTSAFAGTRWDEPFNPKYSFSYT